MAASDPPWEAFADPTRRTILRLLGERGELAAGAIAAELTTVGRTSVSAQLRVLRSAGLVVERRSGRQRIYAIQPGAADEIQAFLGALYRDSLDVVKLGIETSQAVQITPNPNAHAQAALIGRPGGLAPTSVQLAPARRWSSEKAGYVVAGPNGEGGSGRPAVFADADEVYRYLGAMFSQAVQQPFFVEATKDSGLVLLLTQTDPAATMLIDFPRQKVVCGDAVVGSAWTVQLRMSSNNSNRFWQGHLNLTLALAQQKVKLDGKRSVALKLIRLTEPLFAAYERILRDAGRHDLLV